MKNERSLDSCFPTSSKPLSSGSEVTEAATKRAFVDADDLWTPEQIFELLVPLKEQVPKLHITLYGVPNRLGPIHDLKKIFSWITFGIHGFEHTFAECRAWHSEQAKALLSTALTMGYDPVFKPPNWVLDFETEKACSELGIALHCHNNYTPIDSNLVWYNGTPTTHEYIHTHILRNPATDFITENAKFEPEYLNQFDEFLKYGVQDACQAT